MKLIKGINKSLNKKIKLRRWLKNNPYKLINKKNFNYRELKKAIKKNTKHIYN